MLGKVLASLGLLSKGDVIIKNPSDFIGSALGSSEHQTRSILSQAEGCILIIDEAYLLHNQASVNSNPDPYKAAVIDTLVEQIQGVPGEDRVVILCGYQKQMESMMAAVNPGFSRRFQMENAIIFNDYSDEALTRILVKKCKLDGLIISLEVALYAIKKLAKAKEQPNFGNAGAVTNILSEAKKSMQSRLSSKTSASSSAISQSQQDTLLACDFGYLGNEDDILTGDSDQMNDHLSHLFDGLIASDAIINKLNEYKDLIRLCQSKGQDPKQFIEFNFIFAGAPGTGKDLSFSIIYSTMTYIYFLY